MAARERYHTLEQFEMFIERPENMDKLFEFIGGEIVEVPSNPYVSKIAGIILTFINLYLFNNKIGDVTGEAGGYMVAGERYAPDVAFISYDKQIELTKEGYNPNPPDLAVEVISSNRAAELHRLRVKISNYLLEGTIVWVVNPEEQQVEVHAPGKTVRRFLDEDVLEIPELLPGFKLKVVDIFTK